MEHLIEDDLKDKEPKGDVEVARDLLVSSNLLKHSIGPLRIQFAGHPKMVELMSDKEMQEPFLKVMAELYAYIYTNDEMATIKAFYVTSAGQKLMRNSYALGMRAAMIMQDWLVDLMDEAEAQGEKFPSKNDPLPEFDTGDSEGDE